MRQLGLRIKATIRRRLQGKGGSLRERLLPAGGERGLAVRLLLRGVVLLRCLPPSRRAYREELRLIAGSGLFDARWYLQRYPDVAQAWIDPLDHFVRYGSQEDRDPGPGFSSSWYKARYADVARSAASPLTHYLLKGKGEGRRGEPDLFGTTTPSPQSEVPASAGKDGSRPAATAAEAAVPVRFRRYGLPQAAGLTPAGGEPRPAQQAPAPASGTLQLGLAGRTLCHVPDAAEHDAAEHDARGWRLAAALLCRLSGVQPAGWMGAAEPPALPAPSDWRHDSVLAFGAEARADIIDICHISSHDLRLRLSCRGMAPEASICAVQLDPFAGHQDLVLSSARLVADGTVFLDVSLANPFLPLLLMLTGAGGELLGTSLLPFPSLCRGGDHHGEALAHAPAADGIAAVRQTSVAILAGWLAAGGPRPSLHIEVSLDAANGAERLLGRSFRDWLRQATSCTMAPVPGDPAGDAARQWLQEVASLGQSDTQSDTLPDTQPAAQLRLSAGSLPSLGALFCSPRAQNGPAPVILCDGLSGSPQWLLVPPEQDPGLGDGLAGTLAGALAGSQTPFASWGTSAAPGMAEPGPVSPAALHFLSRKAPSQAELVSPFSAEVTPEQILPGTALAHPAPGLSVLLIHEGDNRRLTASLEALLLQAWSGPLHILVAASAGHAEDAATVLSHCLQQVEDGQPARSGGVTGLDLQTGTADTRSLSPQSGGDLLLVMRSGVLLHDTRCLEILARVLSLPSTLSASCMLVAGHWGRKSDEFVLVQCGSLAGPAFGQAVNYSTRFPASALAALPAATWPVAAAAPSLFLTRHADWERYGRLDAAEGFVQASFRETSAADGGLHRVTTTVSASLPLPASGARGGAPLASLLPGNRHDGPALRLQRLIA
jgi:hypothetical protein